MKDTNIVSSLDMQLMIACAELRNALLNERKAVDYKSAWRKMALTSTQRREYEKKWTSDIYARR